jgi:hypothetical protein
MSFPTLLLPVPAKSEELAEYGPDPAWVSSQMAQEQSTHTTLMDEDKHRLYEAGTRREVLGERTVLMTMTFEPTVRG